MGDQGWWSRQRYHRDQSRGSESLASTRTARGQQRSMRSKASGWFNAGESHYRLRTQSRMMGEGSQNMRARHKEKQTTTEIGKY